MRFSLLALTVCCSLIGVAGAVDQNTKPILALIPAVGDRRPAPAVMNQLEAAWLQQPNVTLVERQSLEKILTEHHVTGAALVDVRARVQLGRFVAADLLVFVDSIPKLPKPASRIQVTETKSGVVLVSQILENEILLKNLPAAIDLIQTAIHKQAVPASDRHVLGYLDFRSEESGPLLDGTAAALGTLVITDLSRVPHIIVLEREYLSHLQVERDLTALEQDLRTSVRLLEGGIRRGTDTNTLTVTVLLRPLTGGAPLQITLTVPADINRARDQIAQEITRQLHVKRPETTEADRATEAQIFGKQATLLSAWGDRHRSIHAAETAFALSPSQTNRWLVARMLTEGQTSLGEAIRGNDLLLDYYRLQANAISTGVETNRLLPTLGYWMDLPAREDSVAERKQLDELEERVFRFRLDHYRTYYETMSNAFWNTWIDRLELFGPYFSGDQRRQIALVREAYETFLHPPADPELMSGERMQVLRLIPQCSNGLTRRSPPGHWLRPPLGYSGKQRDIYDLGLPPEVGQGIFEEFTRQADPYVRLIGYLGLDGLVLKQPSDAPGRLLERVRLHQEILRIVAEDMPATHPYRKARRDRWGPNCYGEYLLISACYTVDFFDYKTPMPAEVVQKELDLYVRILRDMISTGDSARIAILEQMASLHLRWLNHLDKNGRLNDAVELARGLVEVLKKDSKRNFYGYQVLADRLAFYERLAHLQPDTSAVANTNAVNAPVWDEYEILRMDLGLSLTTSHSIYSRSSLLMTSDGNRLYCVQPILREGAVDLQLTTHWLPTGSMLGVMDVATRIPISRNEQSWTTWLGTVYAIARDGDTVYVGTRAGLAAISLKTRQGKLITPEQGLPGPIVRALTWHQGKLYLGIGADPYNRQIDGLAVFAAYDPATARFEVIAAEKAVSRENSWNGMKFQIDDMFTDEPGNCLWIKERKTGIWKFTPTSGTLTNVAAMIPRSMLVGGRFVGHPNYSSTSPGYVTFFAPPDLTPRRLADPVGGLSLISESAAVELDGDNVIAAASGRNPSGKQRVLFVQKPGGVTAPLTLTPAGKPFPGALHLHKSPAGIVAVTEDGEAILLRRKGKEQEYRRAELQAASGNAQESALLDAAECGDLSQIKSLLANKVDINAVDGRGFAPLHYALQRRHSDAALLLIEQGADVNQKTEQGSAPLAFAAEVDDVAAVKQLLGRRVPVETVNLHGGTALWYAARSGATNAARLLLAAGANVHHRSGIDLHPTLLMECARRGQLDSIKLLLQQGVQLDGLDDNGNTALNYAVNTGQSNVVRYLIQRGANVNTPNRRRWTPLMQAVEFKQLECVRLLIKGGADVNATRAYGKTALMDAAASSPIEIVQCLLDHGAKASAQAELGWTALRYAETKKRYDVALLLRRALESEAGKVTP